MPPNPPAYLRVLTALPSTPGRRLRRLRARLVCLAILAEITLSVPIDLFHLATHI